MPALGLTSPLPLTSDDEGVKRTPERSAQPYSDVVRHGSAAFQGRFTGKPRSLKKEAISHLSSSLNFDGDVVSARCPESIPYSEAKQQLQTLLRHRTVRFEGLRNANEPEIGRYDMRGETRKHRTCSTRRAKTCSSEERKTSAGFGEGSRALLALPKKKEAKMGIARSVSESDISSFPPLERLSVVGRWQVAALASVSTETAGMFVDKVQGSERQWLEEFLEQKSNYESGRAKSSTVEASKVLTNDIVLSIPPPRADFSLVQEATIPSKNYLMEIRRGAIPIYQKAEFGTIKDSITLSNNARFNKVLQPAFPLLPLTWMDASVQDQGRRGRTFRSIKGYRKWKKLPVQAPVSNMWHRYNKCVL